MFIAIVQHTPVWVWVVLAALVGLGVSQSRAREASLGRIAVVPVAMVGLSLFGVTSAFGPQTTALLSWAAGLFAAVVFGQRAVAVRGATWSAATRRLHLPGSWLPLVLIVTLFLIKYCAGVSLGLHPSLRNEPLFAASFSLAYGLFSGLFLARSLSLRTVATRAGTAQPA